MVGDGEPLGALRPVSAGTDLCPRRDISAGLFCEPAPEPTSSTTGTKRFPGSRRSTSISSTQSLSLRAQVPYFLPCPDPSSSTDHSSSLSSNFTFLRYGQPNPGTSRHTILDAVKSLPLTSYTPSRTADAHTHYASSSAGARSKTLAHTHPLAPPIPSFNDALRLAAALSLRAQPSRWHSLSQRSCCRASIACRNESTSRNVESCHCASRSLYRTRPCPCTTHRRPLISRIGSPSNLPDPYLKHVFWPLTVPPGTNTVALTSDTAVQAA